MKSSPKKVEIINKDNRKALLTIKDKRDSKVFLAMQSWEDSDLRTTKNLISSMHNNHIRMREEKLKKFTHKDSII